MPVALSVALACSAGGPKEPGVSVRPQRTTSIVTKLITASVLITSQPVDASNDIKTIRASPRSLALELGETVDLSAQAFGAGGKLLSDVEFAWTVADPRAGRISKGSRFRASGTPGVFRNAISVTGIQNTPRGIQYASASVTVAVVGEAKASKLASLAILPEKPRVLTGQIYRLRAAGFDEDGLVIPGVSFVWQVNDPALGRVNSLGYLTVKGAAGPYWRAVTVTGIWEGVRIAMTTDVSVLQAPEADDFLSVQILPQRFFMDPGDRLHLRAVALNGLGELVSGTELRWSMISPDAGTIDGRGVFVAGKASGIYTEAVKVEAIVPGERGFARAVDFASVVIRSARSTQRLESVWVLPESVLVAPGGRIALLAQPVDELGNPAEKTTTSWHMAQEGVGVIDGYGSFTATGKAGRYSSAIAVTVRQQLGDEVIVKTESVDVAITGTLSQVEVRPTLATIAPGRTIKFSVAGYDENGVQLPGLVTRWSLSDKSIGKIDAFGNFTAGTVSGMYQDVIRAQVNQTISDLY